MLLIWPRGQNSAGKMQRNVISVEDYTQKNARRISYHAQLRRSPSVRQQGVFDFGEGRTDPEHDGHEKAELSRSIHDLNTTGRGAL